MNQKVAETTDAATGAEAAASRPVMVKVRRGAEWREGNERSGGKE